MNVRTRAIDIGSVWLEPGRHRPPQISDPGNLKVFDVMELTAYVAGEPWSDRPRCVSPLLGGYMRVLNDHMEPVIRQRLKEYVTRMIGTGVGLANPAPVEAMGIVGDHDTIRAYKCARSIVTRWLPEYLERHGCERLAQRVSAQPEITDAYMAHTIRDFLRMHVRVPAWTVSHKTGAAIDAVINVLVALSGARVTGEAGYADIGTCSAQAYVATHTDAPWDDALSLFDALLLVGNITS